MDENCAVCVCHLLEQLSTVHKGHVTSNQIRVSEQRGGDSQLKMLVGK